MLSDDSSLRSSPGKGIGSLLVCKIDKDGMYHVAATRRGENVRMSEDFFIEARKDSPPKVKINRPGRDVKVNPIEEVSVHVKAEDDFGLNDVRLHYSVNGGAEKTISMLGQKGVKTAYGNHLIALEDYKLSPGDLVSLYATARDARNTTKTDIYFIQAEPFERNYSQSQQGGGGGAAWEGDRSRDFPATKGDHCGHLERAEERTKGLERPREDARFLGDRRTSSPHKPSRWRTA